MVLCMLVDMEAIVICWYFTWWVLGMMVMGMVGMVGIENGGYCGNWVKWGLEDIEHGYWVLWVLVGCYWLV